VLAAEGLRLGPLPARLRWATSVEYGLIAVLVAVGMLAGLKALGAGNSSSWSSTSNRITAAMKDRAP